MMTGATVFLLADLAGELSRPDLAWMDTALCAEVGGDLWFPEKGDPVRPAKQVCMACEVRTQCLDYAIDNNISHGVWGGLSEKRRRELRSARRERAA